MGAVIAVVIAGLDPAIHPVRKKVLTRRMDPRVKPAGDGRFAWYETLPLTRPSLRSGHPLPASRGEGKDRVRCSGGDAKGRFAMLRITPPRAAWRRLGRRRCIRWRCPA